MCVILSESFVDVQVEDGWVEGVVVCVVGFGSIVQIFGDEVVVVVVLMELVVDSVVLVICIVD